MVIPKYPFRFKYASLFIAVLVAAWMFANPPVFAQDAVDDVQSILEEARYPWYDAANDGLKPVDLPAATEAASKNRNRVTKIASKTPAAGPIRARSDFFELSVLAWVLIGLVIVAIIVLLVWAFFKMEQRQSGNRGIRPDESGATRQQRIKELPFDLRKTTGDFRQLAHDAYLAGDYRTAITFLFSHVLLLLDSSGVIQLRKGKTNRQYLMELGAHDDLSNYYESVMVPFEDVFFGDHEINKNSFDNCWDNLESFQVQVKQTSNVAG